MPRERKSTRAESYDATRRRILDAAERCVAERTFGVREIAERAGVTVQTVYAHFTSKAGLITALMQEVSRSHGLVTDLGRVWQRDTGRRKLEAMVEATFAFWHRAWPYISFMLVARREDEEFAAQVRGLDEARLSDLTTICDELAADHELRQGLRPQAAAALVFALVSPAVYEELVASGRMPFAAASRMIAETVRRAVLARP